MKTAIVGTLDYGKVRPPRPQGWRARRGGPLDITPALYGGLVIGYVVRFPDGRVKGTYQDRELAVRAACRVKNGRAS